MIMKSFPMSKTSILLSQISLVLLTPLAAVKRLEGSRSSEVSETELGWSVRAWILAATNQWKGKKIT